MKKLLRYVTCMLFLTYQAVAQSKTCVLALQAGCDVVKAFPGGLLGPSFIKDVKGPIPHAEIMPSGGVSLDNMADWVEKRRLGNRYWFSFDQGC